MEGLMQNTDLASHFRTVEKMLNELLDSLIHTLTSADVAYVREIASYSEFGDALENLVALLSANRATLDGPQVEKLVNVWQLIGPDNVPLVGQLLARDLDATTDGHTFQSARQASGRVLHMD